MAQRQQIGLSPFNRRRLALPPTSLRAWVRLATWQIWMGGLVAVIVGFAVTLIRSAPTRLATVFDFTNCYAPPPVPEPCARALYTTGALNAAFTVLFGVVLLAVAFWFLWELWSAVEPPPLTDDFLKLLDESFARNWRSPRTWPWARVLWAYGFTLAGAGAAVGMAVTVSALLAPPPRPAVPIIHVDVAPTVWTP
jgi:hypothetical protein